MKKLIITALAGVTLLLAGCSTENGVFASRTGEFYKRTRDGSVFVSGTCFRLGQIPVVGWFVFFPVGLVSGGIELFVVNPVWDTLMLPVDLCQPRHGFYVKVVDEDGRPVPYADVSLEVIASGNGDTLFDWSRDYEGCTDAEGLMFVPRLDCLPSWIRVSAEGFRTRQKNIVCTGHRDGEYLRGPNWSEDEKGRLILTTRIFHDRSLEPTDG